LEISGSSAITRSPKKRAIDGLDAGLLIAALRSPGMPRVIAFLSREQATKEQVGLVVKHAASTAKILDELAAVRGQVHGGLVKLGVAQSNASRVAYWIEKALDWGL
jgi:hypothetical protein